MGYWMRVDELLPMITDNMSRESNEVLALAGGRVYIAKLHQPLEDYPACWHLQGRDWYTLEGVTHWAPVPRPPGDHLLDLLRAAVARVRLANITEGNPILAAWLPDAEAAIREGRRPITTNLEDGPMMLNLEAWDIRGELFKLANKVRDLQTRLSCAGYDADNTVDALGQLDLLAVRLSNLHSGLGDLFTDATADTPVWDWEL